MPYLPPHFIALRVESLDPGLFPEKNWKEYISSNLTGRFFLDETINIVAFEEELEAMLFILNISSSSLSITKIYNAKNNS